VDTHSERSARLLSELALSPTELEQVEKRLSDPEFDRAVADLHCDAYEAYNAFARQVPNLLALPEENAGTSFTLVRQVGTARAADLLIAGSLIRYAADQKCARTTAVGVPPEAEGAFTTLARAFAIIAQLNDRQSLQEALDQLPSTEEVDALVGGATVRSWLDHAPTS
jgi:hypothetical protein